MGKRSLITPEEKSQIEELNSQGKSLQEIAFALDRPYKTIYNEIRRHRVNGAYSAKKSIDSSKEARKNLKKLWRKGFTEEEKETARAMLKEGKTFKRIRATLGLSYARTIRIIEEVTGKEVDAPSTNSQTSLWQRVYALEEQVKVLFELLNPQ